MYNPKKRPSNDTYEVVEIGCSKKIAAYTNPNAGSKKLAKATNVALYRLSKIEYKL